MKRKGNAEKNAFRRTKEWKDFSKRLRDESGGICECCGTKSKTLQVHHAVPEDYRNLDESNFYVVCSGCHKQISKCERIKPENRYKYNPDWVAFYERFLKPKTKKRGIKQWE